MNYNITFCSKKNCKNKDCERNQKNIDKDYIGIGNVWISDFKDCKEVQE